MTNEEALEILKSIEILSFRDKKRKYFMRNVWKAQKVAIEALEQQQNIHDTCKKCVEFSEFEQQPCEDAISRESVIEWLKDKDIIKTKNQEENARRELAELPSVTPKIEVSEDCISRVETLKHSHIEYDDDGEGHRVVYVEEIKDLPSVTPQQTKWIPISERLPEVGSEVLVCFDFKGNRSVYISDFYGDGEFHGLDDEYLTPEGRKCRKAVAWMPLPQPYKAESEDKG